MQDGEQLAAGGVERRGAGGRRAGGGAVQPAAHLRSSAEPRGEGEEQLVILQQLYVVNLHVSDDVFLQSPTMENILIITCEVCDICTVFSIVSSEDEMFYSLLKVCRSTK